MIELIENKVFRCYTEVDVEYHAGVFFVRKEASYLFFKSSQKAVLYQRKEGGTPFDSDCHFFMREILEEKKGLEFEISHPQKDVPIFKLKSIHGECFFMPSSFMEYVLKNRITEILLDNKIAGTKGIFVHVPEWSK
ncbi:hypothetical protein [Pedobacter sp. SYSU D00535]|uniref:hypothetical protein n=1 Tax=Pedobacter sp. SYSU D00535 TaxID=2810308 RepID=UPI001A968C3B|nr:hypothetical protein [Pedobacter sp. SYSU D00535]